MKLSPTFVCQNCSFRYRSKAGKMTPPNMCPNCGKEGTMIIQPDAESLIRDVDKIMGRR